MVVVDLIVALGVPMWHGGEDLLHARREAEPVTDDVDEVDQRAPVAEPSARRTA